MAKRLLSENERDFLDRANAEHPAFGKFVSAKLDAGLHPKDIATLLRKAADDLSGWCLGRYGSAA